MVRSDVDFPQQLAAAVLEGQHVLPVAQVAHGEHAAVHDRDAGKPSAESLGLPGQGRPAFRPAVEQTGLGGATVAMDASPPLIDSRSKTSTAQP